ncbi:MAG: hypothetical protein NTZ74_16640 [Chloroflexi bacterium]|nr:hypothetical protein [Chloroflexota bacterium]
MTLVYVKNKKNGNTYVYESNNYWDKKKQQSRSSRVCSGKLNEAGDLIPSKRFKEPKVRWITLLDRERGYCKVESFLKVEYSIG